MFTVSKDNKISQQETKYTGRMVLCVWHCPILFHLCLQDHSHVPLESQNPLHFPQHGIYILLLITVVTWKHDQRSSGVLHEKMEPGAGEMAQ